MDRSNNDGDSQRIHMDQSAPHGIRTWHGFVDILRRGLLYRHPTPPDPAPHQHLRRSSWTWAGHLASRACTYPVGWTWRSRYHAGPLLFWSSLLEIKSQTHAGIRSGSRR